MPAASKSVVLLLPALAVLAACEPAPYHPSHAVSAPPPAMAGALGAPLAPSATTALAGSTVPPAPATPERMSATDIAATLSNNTAEGVTANGLGYAAYFAANGEERFRQGAFNDAGTWRVRPDGELCSAMVQLNGNVEQCYLMYRSGNVVTFQRPDGVTVGSVTVVPGNPLSL